jgi:pimeloyl-ACP methyl ester carboxylesterase
MSVVRASAHPTSWVPAGEHELAVLDVGGGGARAAVLVPGYTGSKEDFGPLLPALTGAGHRCVAYDQRGQYESPGSDDPLTYTVDSLAADLLALVASLDLARPHLVGHSFGGLVARTAVIASPGAFASLTLLGSGPAALTGARVERFQMFQPVIDEMGHVAAFDVISAADTRLASMPELREFLRTRWARSTEAGLRGMGEAVLTEPDRCAALRETGVPVLVAHGQWDDCWSPEIQAEMAGRLGAEHVVIPDAMHSPNSENPPATAAALLAFWSRHP